MENRYYDTVETPQTGKTFLDGGENRIIQTDDRVKNWFEPLPDGYIRVYDVNGLPSTELTPSPTPEEIVATKWYDLFTFLSTLTRTTIAGNKFDVSPNGLSNITQRINTMTDADTDIWYEDWASFTVNKAELQEALVKQAEAKKAKIAELFGAV